MITIIIINTSYWFMYFILWDLFRHWQKCQTVLFFCSSNLLFKVWQPCWILSSGLSLQITILTSAGCSTWFLRLDTQSQTKHIWTYLWSLCSSGRFWQVSNSTSWSSWIGAWIKRPWRVLVYFSSQNWFVCVSVVMKVQTKWAAVPAGHGIKAAPFRFVFLTWFRCLSDIHYARSLATSCLEPLEAKKQHL